MASQKGYATKKEIVMIKMWVEENLWIHIRENTCGYSEEHWGRKGTCKRCKKYGPPRIGGEFKDSLTVWGILAVATALTLILLGLSLLFF